MHKRIQKQKIKDLNSRLTSEDIEACKDPAVLQEWKIYLESSIADANVKINTAKGVAASKGDFMDPEKYQRLISYKKVLGFLHQRILFQQRLLKEENKMIEHFPRIFMQTAKAILSEEEYEKIRTKAQELMVTI